MRRGLDLPRQDLLRATPHRDAPRLAGRFVVGQTREQHLSPIEQEGQLGVALHRLGLSVGLMGKVGDDIFGRAILELFAAQGASTDDMIVAAGVNAVHEGMLLRTMEREGGL